MPCTRTPIDPELQNILRVIGATLDDQQRAVLLEALLEEPRRTADLLALQLSDRPAPDLSEAVAAFRAGLSSAPA